MTTWDGRRVLVTGAGGFIGSHLVELLVAAGAEVRALTHYNSRSDPGMLTDVPADVRAAVEIMPGDITDPFLVRRAVAGVRHRVPPRRADRDPVLVRRAGVLCGHERHRHAQRAGGGAGSRDPAHGAHLHIGNLRDRALHTRSTSSIRCSRSRHTRHRSSARTSWPSRSTGRSPPRSQQSGRSTRTARGRAPARSSRRSPPSWSPDRHKIALGDLRPVRDLTYVTDTARGFLAVAASDECIGTVTNIGNGKGISIGDLARMMAEVAGRRGLRDRRGERAAAAHRTPRCSSSSPMPPRRGPAAAGNHTFRLREGLSRVVAYVRANLHRYDVDRYTT